MKQHGQSLRHAKSKTSSTKEHTLYEFIDTGNAYSWGEMGDGAGSDS
jgi:hypothetical protein